MCLHVLLALHQGKTAGYCSTTCTTRDGMPTRTMIGLFMHSYHTLCATLRLFYTMLHAQHVLSALTLDFVPNDSNRQPVATGRCATRLARLPSFLMSLPFLSSSHDFSHVQSSFSFLFSLLVPSFLSIAPLFDLFPLTFSSTMSRHCSKHTAPLPSPPKHRPTSWPVPSPPSIIDHLTVFLHIFY